jgi:hypothetical protein
MMVYDVAYPIVTEVQSNIVTNPNWASANQKVHLQVLSSSDVVQGSLATFANSAFDITLPAPLANVGTNVTMKLLVFQKDCANAYKNVMQWPTFATDETFVNSPLQPKEQQINLYLTNCATETFTSK